MPLQGHTLDDSVIIFFMRRLITTILYLLVLLIPLALTTVNHELFEFPKFILLLAGTLIITIAWGIDLAQNRDWRQDLAALRSPVTYAVILILATQTLATLFSINPYTSFWGYYTRFHGGLLTTICYTIIYLAAVKWLDTESTQKIIKISVGTAFIIGIYAVLEHFGIDKNFWRQDVQNRVFSTLGQPNWLAAYLIPNLFLLFYLHQSSPSKKNLWFTYLIFAVLFSALIFTKSRSGFLAVGFSLLTYYFLQTRFRSFVYLRQFFRPFLIVILAVILFFGTPFSAPLSRYLSRESLSIANPPTGTALESGGTESGDIRKIVWSGALKLIAKYPALGTGPETFAYTYYWVRPAAHNLTSEWDFIYNKAHNEYLNLASGAGLIGLTAYLFWHYTLLKLGLSKVAKSKKVNQQLNAQLRCLYPVLGASLVGFTLTNFFGFSVIPVYLLMILLGAFPTTIQHPPSTDGTRLDNSVFAGFTLMGLSLVIPLRLWLADYYFTLGKAYLDNNQSGPALTNLETAVKLRPGLDLFHSSLAEAYAGVASAASVSNDEALKAQSSKYVNLALEQANLTKTLNPYHLNYFKSRAKVYLTLALIDNTYNSAAEGEIKSALALAPTDPKLTYNLGLIYTRLNRLDLAESSLRSAIALKPNYPDPYYALTLLYEQTKHQEKIPPLLNDAKANLATYSAQLAEKMAKYTSP